MDCVCDTCERAYEYDRRKGHTKTRCNSCRSSRGGRSGRDELKQRMVDYLGGECQIPSCRYSKHLRNLTFHHVDPETKAFNIAGSHCRSWKTLQAELDKCVLLCIRCHVEVEDGLIEIPAAVLEPVLAHVATLPKTRIAPKRASALV